MFKFRNNSNKKEASHNDILPSSQKIPEILWIRLRALKESPWFKEDRI
tara:strand:- start:170 stop:313 length:144 start_codon:yes stop_codon:yes gene_type:complete